MKISFLSGKRLALLLHIAAWTVLFIIPVYLFSFETKRDEFFVARVCLRTSIYILIFYLNYFWLIPKIMFKGRKLYYYLITASIIVSLYITNDTINNFIFNREAHKPKEEMVSKNAGDNKMPNNFRKFDIYNFLFTSILISGFSIGLRMLDQYNENEKQRKDLEKERLNSELSFLKNQISPHFFFNTLNNIYSLVEINKTDAQNAILQLSKMMRYMLYESEQGNTLLSKEITFMKNYIELMKLRLTDKVHLQVNFPEEGTDTPIAPLLFIPFIENAFKHGISNREPSYIDISMRINQSEILFLCNNSIVMGADNNNKDDSGIGLENVRKRLTLLFPEKHQLSINQTSSAFEVLLQINR